MNKWLGEGTVVMEHPVYIRGVGTAVGSTEAQGPLGEYFDVAAPDATWGEDSFEKAEKKLFTEAVKQALQNAGLGIRGVDMMIGGDLLNQIITASYAARDFGLRFIGLYGACSSMTESLALGAMLLDGGFGENILCATSSHFATAERQFRYPLELGTPKPPTGQDTVTGAGATVLSANKSSLCITAATVGRVVDFGISDANNMGAAMAPAATETILTHLEKRGAAPGDFDAIITGDLGIFGSELLADLAGRCGVSLAGVHRDCGKLIYAGMKNKRCGASGCGCCATVLNGYFLKRMAKGEYRRLLVVATGALMSPTIVQQGESIPGIAHAVEIERREG